MRNMFLFCGCSLLASVVMTAAARAEGAPAAPAEAASDVGAGDIVVTANKREQNLNKVGLTVAAMSGEALANARVSNVADLAKVTPGLTFAPTPNATPVYTLRGVGFFEASLAAYPDVSLYIDQTPLPLPVLASLTAFDLERVEVLKGPQGTLFGNNATGGAINFVAVKPTDELHFGADMSYGRFNTFETNGYISGPITGNLNARLAVKAVKGDEWQRSYTRDDKLGKLDNIAGRLILDWKPTERLKLSLNVNGWIDQNDPTAPQYTKATPQNPPGSAGPGGVVPADLPIFVYPPAPHNARAADWNPDLRPYANNKFWQVALRGDYEVTDDITLTSLSSYDRLRFLNATEGDGTALEGLDLGRDYGRIKSFSQEIRLANGPGNRLRWVVGANYEHTTVYEMIQLYISGTSSAAANGFNGNFYGSNQRMNNYAGFANAEFDITDKITLKGGIRQTKAKRNAIMYAPFEPDGFYKPGAFGENSLTKFFNATYAYLASLGAYGPGVTIPTIAVGDSIAIDTRTNPDGTPVDPATYLKTGNPTGKLSENSTSWSAGVDFKPSRDLLLYLNVSKGYKAGSFPTLAGAIYDAFAPVKQESLLDYEAGFKAQIFDRRLSVTGAAFYYDYSNKQLRAKFVDPIFGALDKLVNVPKSRIKGAELTVSGRPFGGLTISASGTYLDAKVRKYNGITGSAVDPVTGLRIPVVASFKGASLPYSPKWQFALRADYEFPINGTLAGFLGAGLSGQSKSLGILTVSEQAKQDYKINARALVDLNAAIGSADGKWRAGVWSKNVFNKYYWVNAIQSYDNIMRYAARPAEYGVTIAYKY